MTAELLHELLDEATARRPEHPAVRCNGAELSYRELRAASDGIANTLVAHGVGRGDRVGILLPKSVEMIAAVYGILKTGAAYVPLDPRAPVVRVAGVAEDCGLKGLIATPLRAGALLEAAAGLAPSVVILVGPREPGAAPVPDSGVPFVAYEAAIANAEAATGEKRDPTVPGDLAYILYTSGSTGVPKGVMLTHANALAFVNWCAVTIGITPDDRVSNHAPLHFDLSVLDLYLPAVAAATVIPLPEESAGMGAELVRFIRDESITLWYSVPSALMMIVRSAAGDAAVMKSLRTIIFAGEVYPTKHLRRLRELVGDDIPMWNLYGPTETNVCTYYRVGVLPDDDRTLPIGRACENGTQAFPVDEAGAVVETSGGEGELLVMGPTVMQGYWDMPERTADVLIPDPRGGSAPVYRTGDLVRLREDGDFDFLGRRDHQVKSRGYRIELGDVEAALNADPDLADAVAVAIPHEDWGSAIVACVVGREGIEIRSIAVRRHAAELLPRYMVPARVDVLDALPRTPNGKIDRARIEESAASMPV